MTDKLLILLFVLASIGGCTKDDICSEDTPTTPLLYIEFRNINDRDATKQVSNLAILLNDGSETVVEEAFSGTELLLPLDTESTNSVFQFVLDSNNENTANTDLVGFNYMTDNLYVNRACAFKAIYTDLVAVVEQEPLDGNWIQDFELLTTRVEDETSVHLYIYH